MPCGSAAPEGQVQAISWSGLFSGILMEDALIAQEV
jgi:hypothetical protein